MSILCRSASITTESLYGCRIVLATSKTALLNGSRRSSYHGPKLTTDCPAHEHFHHECLSQRPHHAASPAFAVAPISFAVAPISQLIGINPASSTAPHGLAQVLASEILACAGILGFRNYIWCRVYGQVGDALGQIAARELRGRTCHGNGR
ncbi:hypothetical protein FPV67DRAFT_1515266 [Lyophyllum atratum]|nr:hypothetical protein FPV67DRAFT_1515266 [Lyophyllum atratum]